VLEREFVMEHEFDRVVELIGLAEAHSPETRGVGENASAQAAALGFANSELFPAREEP